MNQINRLGKYELKKKLGQGVGHHFLGENPDTQQLVFLKLLPPVTQAQQWQSILEETQKAAQVSHPNCVDIYDIFYDARSQRPVLVTEYIDGCNGAEFARHPVFRKIRQSKQSCHTVSFLALEQILRALTASHQAGVIHGGLKPENILIRADIVAKLEELKTIEDIEELVEATRQFFLAQRKSAWLKVHDWGLAFFRWRNPNTPLAVSLTQLPQAKQKSALAYLSPEQFERGESLAKSDVFAAGLILYELLTGHDALAGRLRGEGHGSSQEIELQQASLALAMSEQDCALSIQSDPRLQKSLKDPTQKMLLEGMCRRQEAKRLSLENVALALKMTLQNELVPPAPEAAQESKVKRSLPLVLISVVLALVLLVLTLLFFAFNEQSSGPIVEVDPIALGLKNGRLEVCKDIKKLTPELIEQLQSFKQKLLPLDRLESLNSQEAKELAKHSGALSFKRLKTISEDSIGALAIHRGGLILDGLFALTQEEAALLSNYQGPLLSLRGLKELDQETLKTLANYKGNLILSATFAPKYYELVQSDQNRAELIQGVTSGTSPTLNQFTDLSPKDAEALRSKIITGPIKLNKLKALEAKVARILKGHEGSFEFNGLTNVSPAALKELSSGKITALSLNGLTQLSEDQGRALNALRCPLQLNGLKKVETRALEFLVANKKSLSLNGLTTLTPRQAELLSEVRESLSLNSLEDLSPGVCKGLSEFRGHLQLNKVKALSVTAAEAFSPFRGSSLKLEGLLEPPQAVIDQLAKIQSTVYFHYLVANQIRRVRYLEKQKGPILEQVKKGDFSSVPLLMGLTPELASLLAQSRVEKLQLRVESLDMDCAKELAKYTGKLSLDGLKTIDAKTLGVIARGSSPELSFGSLQTLGRDQLKALTAYRGNTLKLGVQSVKEFDASGLTPFQANLRTIHFTRLTELPQNLAQCLTGAARFYVFYNLQELRENTLKQLGKIQGFTSYSPFQPSLEIAKLLVKQCTYINFYLRGIPSEAVLRALSNCQHISIYWTVSDRKKIKDFQRLTSYSGRLQIYATTIEAEAFAFLAKSKMQQLQFKNLKSLSVKAARSLRSFRGRLYLESLQLPDEVAKALSPFQGQQLYIGQSGSLSPDALRNLAKTKAELYLGDKELEPNLAKALSLYRGPRLTLQLESLNSKLARALAQVKGELYLFRVRSVDLETAKALSSYRGKKLHIPLYAVSPEIYKQLKDVPGLERLRPTKQVYVGSNDPWKNIKSGNFSYIRQLKSLNAEQAQFLVKANQNSYYFDQLHSLPIEAAKELSKYRGARLHFNGLKTLSPEAAKALFLCPCQDFGFAGLQKIDERLARVFATYGYSLTLGNPEISEQAAALLSYARAHSVTVSAPKLNPSIAKILSNLKAQISLRLRKAPPPELLALALQSCRGVNINFPDVNDAHIQVLGKLRIQSLTIPRAKLSKKGAKALSSSKVQTLFLSITELKSDAARYLAKFQGKALLMTRLAKLETSAAKHLAKYQGNLTLGGFTKVSNQCAKELGRFEGISLSFYNLDLTNSLQAREFAKVRGSLYFGGRGFTARAAAGLSSYRGTQLRFGRVDKPSLSMIREFVKIKAPLVLSSVRELNAKKAQELAKFRGPRLELGLRDLDVETAKALCKVRGELVLSQLKGLTKELAEVFQKRSGKLKLSYYAKKALEKLSKSN